MSDRKTSGWRAWAAATIFTGLLVAGFLISRPAPEPAPVPAPTSIPSPVATPIVPRPLQPLSRTDLIEAAGLAANRFASGEPAPASDLPGRRFVLNLPFGCAGPAADLKKTDRGWVYDEKEGTLRAKATPQVWTDAPFLKAIAPGVAFEAAEGFWIERPWQLSETCPAPTATDVTAAPETNPARETTSSPTTNAPRKEAAASPATQTLALAELFEPGSKRAERRNGRAYNAVQKLTAGELALDHGLRLVVEGRLIAIAEGQAIGCWSSSPDQRPVCMIRVRFDRVAITGPTGERTLAEWRS